MLLAIMIKQNRKKRKKDSPSALKLFLHHIKKRGILSDYPLTYSYLNPINL